MISKATAKKILGEIPFTAEAYWYLRQGGMPPRTGFKLDQLEKRLPDLTRQASESAVWESKRKNILIFCTLHYWISHGALMGLALAGKGHSVTLAYMPYSNSSQPINKFDLRRQNVYAQNVLQKSAPLLRIASFLDLDNSTRDLPVGLSETIDEVTFRDSQYTLQVEDVSRESSLYLMRQDRNRASAKAMLTWSSLSQPDIVIIPNGSILEFGSAYQVARFLSIPTITYEFGEQRNRVWIAQNAEVMRQQTNELWEARRGEKLSKDSLEKVRTLFSSRQKASLWGNFSRRWQGVPSSGGLQVRSSLNLDGRPVVLLATNVIGDSLTLGRQVFSDNMTEWLQRSVEYFADHPKVQLVVRIHPGELITKGPSVADVINNTFPEGIPENITLITADAEINTYDLVEIADLGLVYTTTVGLEMAMSGVPVVVIGQTHYRGKGFTIDPSSWENYFELLFDFTEATQEFQLDKSQVESAWEYAYRFFFEYPQPYPWHLLHMWEDLDVYPMEFVLSESGSEIYGKTFRYLAGEPIVWTD